MNKVCLSGRTTAKGNYRIGQTGSASCRFTLAVKRRFKNSNGNYESDFINCVAFGKTADILNQYVDKGDLINVEGEIRTGSYTDQNGNRRYTTDVIVNGLDLLSSKKKTEQNNESNYQEPQEEQSDPFADFGEQVSIDDNFLE